MRRRREGSTGESGCRTPWEAVAQGDCNSVGSGVPCKEEGTVCVCTMDSGLRRCRCVAQDD